MIAIVKRYVHAHLGRRIEHAFSYGILTNGVHERRFLYPFINLGPTLAEVASPKDMRLVIVEPMAVDCCVCGGRVEMRCSKLRNLAPIRKTLGSHVRPLPASGARDM